MGDGFVVHGSAGTGSVIVEAALTLLGLPYRLADPNLATDYEGALDAALAVNPMRQLPALILPSGEVMTESCGILIWLTETYGDGALAPRPGDPARPAFLRWMAFVNSQLYAHFWVRDDASRVVTGGEAQKEVTRKLAERIAYGFGVMEAGTGPGPYVLGEQLTPLDLYVAVISRWVPGRKKLGEIAPRLREASRRVDTDPRLTSLWAERYPFPDGWDG
jgi:GST-like protein